MDNPLNLSDLLQLAAIEAVKQSGDLKGSEWAGLAHSYLHQLGDYQRLVSVDIAPEDVQQHSRVILAHHVAALAVVCQSVDVSLHSVIELAAAHRVALYDLFTKCHTVDLPRPLPPPDPKPATPTRR